VDIRNESCAGGSIRCRGDVHFSGEWTSFTAMRCHVTKCEKPEKIHNENGIIRLDMQWWWVLVVMA
jgi:hypothetical protein